MQNKSELICRGILVILFIAFLAIFYRYSENGRYAYNKEIGEGYENKYVVDTRTGTIYEWHFISPPGLSPSEGFYKVELQTGRKWYIPLKIEIPNPSAPK
jgi:hypothetical protein